MMIREENVSDGNLEGGTIFVCWFVWLRWVFVAACGLSLRGSYCGGFSCCGARALDAPAQ